MKQTILWLTLLTTACGEKASSLPIGGTPPGGESTDTGSADGDADGSPDAICDESWNHNEAGVSIQPEACLAWSPLSLETMDWYEAASLEEGEEGGCGSDCPTDSEGYCSTLSGLDGRTDWRLPSKRELMDAAQTAPEIPDVDGRLWTLDSMSGATGNAWTVDLGRPGSAMSLGKDDDSIGVRCVSDSQ
jgi:hypothetical protein